MPLIAVAQNRRMNDYVESIRRAGGEPVEVVPGAETPEQILARVDGLMLTGGGDVDPALYGDVANTTFQAAEDGRDDFEIAPLERGRRQRNPLPGDLPRNAGAQRRDGRHARPGHRVRSPAHWNTRCRTHAHAIAHESGYQKARGFLRSLQSHGRRRDGPRQQPP